MFAGVGYPAASVLLGLFLLVIVIRRRYLSPIADIPGPFFASFSVLWQLWAIVKGDIQLRSIELHRKHGHFVRIGHEEVSVCHPDAVRKILLTPLRKVSIT